PGPVCYSRGGIEPTVTDANVVLGYMNPRSIAGSSLKIDREAAIDAIERKLAAPLGLSPLEAAYGVTRVANSAMTRVLRAVSTERGRDPREFTLAAFGGAGPIHAAALAESMEMSRLIVPLHPGLFSALGLLLADYRHDYIASIVSPLSSMREDDIRSRYAMLKETARAEMAAEGVGPSPIRFEQYLDMKYGYQMYEMTLPFPPEAETELTERLARLFTQAHDQAYGYHRDDPIELVSLRLRALASVSSIRFADLAAKASAGGPRTETPRESREAYFGPAYGSIVTPVCARFDIDGPRRGPLIIEEPDTTVVAPPNWRVERDALANLILTRSD
ncbi:MAG TPA: hydantoinase/oxoprolinase family protein, partial [Candidatus Binataceae bacterium]|nr:hydantoinase/oxoprolinase family protein [Candidatus Binataceae bacterium]